MGMWKDSMVLEVDVCPCSTWYNYSLHVPIGYSALTTILTAELSDDTFVFLGVHCVIVPKLLALRMTE